MSGIPELLVGGVNTETLDPALRPAAPGADGEADTIELLLQTRDRQGTICTTKERVDPKKVGIIAVDCWHYHWCRTWRNRAGSLIPRFNYCLNAARKLGMTLVFSPTNAMRDLHQSPQRRATLALPNHPLPSLENFQAAALGAGAGGWPDPVGGALRYGMCECGYGDACFYHNNANTQNPDLEMAADDFIALTQEEAYNIFKERGITHILYMGFATNMCMWAKPTGMKYMQQFDFRCCFARDLTEAITGYVEESFSPTRGTIELIEQIERDLAPSIDMKQTMRKAGAWEDDPVLDYVHIAPWGRLFGGTPYPLPVQAELICRHVPEAELRYTLDGSDPTASSPLYQRPIKINETTLLKAAGFEGVTAITRISEAQYWKYPPVPDPADVFVCDLKPINEKIGEIKPNSYAVKKAARFKRSIDGRVLTNRGRKFGHGIGVQAPSELVFALKPQYKRFVANVGVDDETMEWDNPDGMEQWPQWSRPFQGPTSYRICQIIFEVSIDGKVVHETPPMFNGVSVWGIDVEIPAGAQQITLRAKDAESRFTDAHGHGDWLDAGFRE